MTTFKVTERLKDLLDGCIPSKEMKKIKNYKYLSMKKIEFKESYVSINFIETGIQNWAYTMKFFEELRKNEIQYNHLSLE